MFEITLILFHHQYVLVLARKQRKSEKVARTVWQQVFWRKSLCKSHFLGEREQVCHNIRLYLDMKLTMVLVSTNQGTL